MNVAFFLTPKDRVVWIPTTASLLEALSVMQPHRHSAIPILDPDGRYVATLTEGDVLWFLRQTEGRWQDVAGGTKVTEIDRWMKNEPIYINAEVETLIVRAAEQSFVPVIDDRSVFVGMVRRESIIEYCARLAGILPRDS